MAITKLASTKFLAGAASATLALTLLSSVAFAQSANGGADPDNGPYNSRSYNGSGSSNAPPAQLSQQNGYPDGPYAQGPAAQGSNGQSYGAQPAPSQSAQNDQRAHDMFCRRDAAARTGYVTPGEAAHDEQARGTIGGTLGGAALGAIIGGAAGNAGAGAAIGAGAGLITGTAVGSDNARRAARDVSQDYAAAYYACMGEADNGPPPPRYAASGYGDYYDYGPPPYPYYGYGLGPYPYYPYYYGPSVSFRFGGGWHGGYGGYRGGFHHR